MLIPQLVKTWALTMIFASLFSVGYYSYVAVKRRFDSIYNEKHLLAKRAVHGVVYILLLVLANEAVKIRIPSNSSYGSAASFIVYLFFVAIGFPIFLDIVLSLYKVAHRRGG